MKSECNMCFEKIDGNSDDAFYRETAKELMKKL